MLKPKQTPHAIYAHTVSILRGQSVLPAIHSGCLVFAALATATLLSGCSGPAINTDPSSATSTSTASAASNGLIKAIHTECDVGDQILKYLATGDNQSNPQLDTSSLITWAFLCPRREALPMSKFGIAMQSTRRENKRRLRSPPRTRHRQPLPPQRLQLQHRPPRTEVRFL